MPPGMTLVEEPRLAVIPVDEELLGPVTMLTLGVDIEPATVALVDGEPELALAAVPLLTPIADVPVPAPAVREVEPVPVPRLLAAGIPTD